MTSDSPDERVKLRLRLLGRDQIVDFSAIFLLPLKLQAISLPFSSVTAAYQTSSRFAELRINVRDPNWPEMLVRVNKLTLDYCMSLVAGFARFILLVSCCVKARKPQSQ
jgi:hypothetical protein